AWSSLSQAGVRAVAGRGADQGAELRFTAFQPAVMRLDVSAAGYAGPRLARVLRDGQTLATWNLGALPITFTLPALSIPAGVTVLTLDSDTTAALLPRPTPFDKAQPRAILWATQVRVNTVHP